MKVIVLSGRRKGQMGDIRGDLYERRATLGPDAKVLFRKGKAMNWERCDNLIEANELQKGLFE